MFDGITRWWLIISWAANLDSEAGGEDGEGVGGGRGPEGDDSLPAPTTWEACITLLRRKAEGRGRGGGDAGDSAAGSSSAWRKAMGFVSFSDDLRIDGSRGMGAIGACHVGGPIAFDT